MVLAYVTYPVYRIDAVMLQRGFERTEEELLRERAETLHRASSELQHALQMLRVIEGEIETRTAMLKGYDGSEGQRDLRGEIREGVRKFNEKREYAKLKYYYLVVIREAIGFRNHTWIEKFYTIPAKKTIDVQI